MTHDQEKLDSFMQFQYNFGMTHDQEKLDSFMQFQYNFYWKLVIVMKRKITNAHHNLGSRQKAIA